jgi:hypothetical protein
MTTGRINQVTTFKTSSKDDKSSLPGRTSVRRQNISEMTLKLPSCWGSASGILRQHPCGHGLDRTDDTRPSSQGTASGGIKDSTPSADSQMILQISGQGPSIHQIAFKAERKSLQIDFKAKDHHGQKAPGLDHKQKGQ